MLPRKGGWTASGERLERLAAEATLTGLAATVVLMGVAMWTYPGGTWAERTRLGHAFWENFWCDLLRAEALNGHPNPVASQLAVGAMLLLAATLAAYWVVVARTLAPGRLSRWALGLGWLGSAGFALVALTPSDRFPALHAVAVVTAGPAFLSAVVVGGLGLWRRPGRLRPLTVLAVVGLLLAVVNLVQYARQVYWAAEYARWLPGVQKASTLCFLAWAGLVSVRSFGPEGRLSGPAAPL